MLKMELGNRKREKQALFEVFHPQQTQDFPRQNFVSKNTVMV